MMVVAVVTMNAEEEEEEEESDIHDFFFRLSHIGGISVANVSI